jgi:glycosyltransferase involved in cell wall biosynthesis
VGHADGSKLKIALYVHCFFPNHFYGTEAYTLTLAKALRALGHECFVVTAIFPGEPRQERLVEIYQWDDFPVFSIDKNVLPHRSIKDTYDQPELRVVHERILRRIAPDVVHICHLINHTKGLLDVVSAMNIPTFATLTDFFGFCLNNKLEAADGSLCAGPSATRANCIACHIHAVCSTRKTRALQVLDSPVVRAVASRWLASRPRTKGPPRFGFEPADIVERPAHLLDALSAIKGAIAPSAFLRNAYLDNGFSAPLTLSHFGIEIDRARKPPPSDPGRVRLAFIGQIAPHKGPHLLIEALRLADRPNLSLDIWGPDNQDQAYYAELQQRASGLSISFRGTFASERTPEIMAQTDILVIPSTWYENSPLILLQALATHTPVVVANVLGLTEFVAPGVMGFHFERGSVSSLAEILKRLGDDPALAQTMSGATNYTRTPLEMGREVEGMIVGTLRGRGDP